jgi:hypothetical protein
MVRGRGRNRAANLGALNGQVISADVNDDGWWPA